jgi:hypothetical protein
MYLDPNMALERLRNEWAQHGRLIIAFDYDSTVMPYKQAEYKFDYEPVRELLRELHKEGCILICFTASAPERYEKIKEELKTIKVPFDYFNQSPDFIKGIGGSVKVYANAFLDDRAGLHEVYNNLRILLLERKYDKFSSMFKGIKNQMKRP